MHSIFLNVILQFIEALISFSFYENIRSSVKKLPNLSVIIISYVVMCIFNLLFNYNIVVNICLLVLFHFLFSFFLYKQTAPFSLLYAVLISCLVLITEFSVLNIIAFINGGDMRDFIDNTYSYILLIVFSKSLLFILLKIISGVVNKFKANEKFNFTILIYPLSLLLILVDFVIICSDTWSNTNVLLLLAISSLVLVIAVITTCILQQKQSQKEKELFELKAYQQEQQISTTYFELLEHQNDELQVFVHDTKKHYRTLYGLAENPDKLKEYIEGIVTDLEEANQIGKTSNKLLDLIITKYNYICDKEGVVFEKNIHQSNLSFINDTDLTSIFNNLFDNAIEAARLSKGKSILFSLNKVGNMLVIDITNSCDVPPVVKNHKLISTKKDSVLHGYGFKSICRSVKKYNGDIEWEYKSETQEFVVSIIFPIDSK